MDDGLKVQAEREERISRGECRASDCEPTKARPAKLGTAPRLWLRESTSPGIYFVALDRWLPRRRGGDGAFTSATVSAVD
jgi:hypothetical protein